MLAVLTALIMVFFLGPLGVRLKSHLLLRGTPEEVVVAKADFREVVLTGYTRARHRFMGACLMFLGVLTITLFG
jgi:hypothetical protein